MIFPVFSTAYQTVACKRFIRVMARTWVSRRIDRAGVHNCRRISGSTAWSQHAYGNAADLFPISYIYLDRIAANIRHQAMHRTVANRGRRLPVHRIIVGTRTWTRRDGWEPYGGVPHVTHIHVDFDPVCYGTPDCAR